MTTINIQGLRLTYDGSDDVSAISTTELSLIVPSTSATFSYSIDSIEDGDIPLVDINESNVQQIIVDGALLQDLLANFGFVDAYLGKATWSAGTTTVLALTYEPSVTVTVDMIFVLDGPALTSTTPAEWEAFNDTITFVGAATGAFAPGVDILLTEFEYASLTEDDDFVGTNGKDNFDGGKGDDYFRSSDSKDTYKGGNGLDQVTFHDDPGGVFADLGAKTAIDGWGKKDTLKSIEMLRGSAYDDEFVGDGARNHFRGLEGDDDINGKGGTDLVRYDRDDRYGGSDGVVVNLKKGTATDGFGGTDTLKNIEDVTGTDYKDKITGDSGKNVLTGLDGNDKLFGLGSKDKLFGGAGKDKLDGGKGNDKLTGDGGADTFIFAGTFGKDTITDFQAKDKIDLSDAAGIKDMSDLRNKHLTEVDGNAVITDKDGNTVTLTGYAMDDLVGNDFIF